MSYINIPKILKIQYIGFLFILLSSVVSNSQEPLSLKKAISIALEKNYGIIISKKNDEISAINNSWGNTGLLPTLDVSANSINKKVEYLENETKIEDGSEAQLYAAKGGNLSQPVSDYGQNILSSGVTLNWVIFDGFRAFIRKDKYELLEQLSEGNTDFLVQSTIQSVIEAYYSVQIENEKIAVLEKISKLSQDRLEYINERKNFGIATSYDVLQARTAMLQDKATLLTQKAQRDNSIRNLILLLGLPDSASISLSETIKTTPKLYDKNNAIVTMLSNNPNIKNQYIAMELQKKETILAQRNMFPTFALQSGISINNTAMNYNQGYSVHNSTMDYSLNFSLSFNLFGGGIKKRAVQIAKINESIAEVKKDEIEHKLVNQLSFLFDLYAVRVELLTVIEESLQAAELNLQMSEERFKNGTINSFNFRDIQILYSEISKQYLDAQYQVLTLESQIEAMQGKLLKEYYR
ncbi:MAG: TolC family protein [Bacteroidales bacterium]